MDERAIDPEAQRIAALLALVERDCDQRIREARERAEALAREIVAQARHDATRRVREAAQRARDEAQRRLEAARAELSTKDRERDRELALSLLERAWQELVAQLERAWQDPSTRTRWIAALVEAAATALPKNACLVEHPPGLSGAELQSLLRSAAERTGVTPEPRAPPALTAGLRFITGGTRLDGSIEGLLARADTIKSRLLGELFCDGRAKEAP